MTFARTTVDRAAPLPDDSARLLVYVIYDRRGSVEPYVLHALRELRGFVTQTHVVVNGSLSDDARAELEAVSDAVLVRQNTGLDIGAHRDVLGELGESIGEFDEVIFANDTWYGPIGSFGPVFERMDAQAVDFWGMTDHGREEPNPFTGDGVLPQHIQSYWIAVRRRMLSSHAWKQYWRELPEIRSYDDAVLRHEVRFTEHFSDEGFIPGVAFPAASYPTVNPSLLNADLLIEDGCPILKRRPFFHSPPFLDRNAVIGRWTLNAAARSGYPMAHIWRDLARNVAPKVLNTNAGLLEVLNPSGAPFDSSATVRVVVVAHIYYPEMTSELLGYANNLPVPFDLVVTTADSGRAEEIRAAIESEPRRPKTVDVRVVGSNDGRDQSAFWIECNDILSSGVYDLVVKLHSKKTPQDGYSIGNHFKIQQLTNLLGSPGEASSLLGLFQTNPDLGLVFPPMIHVGYPTMGRGWATNKPAFAELSAELGIAVPLDDVSPLAPYGSMYVARPSALRLLSRRAWRWNDFASRGGYTDGGLAHILERMPAYAAGELGFHSRTVISREYMSVSHTSLDFKLDQMSATLPGYSDEQIAFLRRAGFLGEGKAADIARAYLRLHHPERIEKLDSVLRFQSSAKHWVWRAQRPRTWRRGWTPTG